MLHSKLTQEESRKFFAYFLKAIKVNVKFRKTDYGYRTYDNQYKIFINQNRIVRHRTVRVWSIYEYVNKLEEKSYSINKEVGRIVANYIGISLIG